MIAAAVAPLVLIAAVTNAVHHILFASADSGQILTAAVAPQVLITAATAAVRQISDCCC